VYYYVEGNIFESPAQTLVNTVNTAGAMGKGLAREFKRLFPQMFREYQKLCESKDLRIGKLWLYSTPNKLVLNFPTKKHWRYPSRMGYVEDGLKTFVSNYDRARISSVAFPQLGCGNGELDWRDVKSMMAKYLKKLPIDVYVYEVNRYTFPEHKDVERMREWLVTEPASYPFDEFRRDLENVMSDSSACETTDGRVFSVRGTNELVQLENDGQKVSIPWRGDESGNGWLEFWQFLREKGVCTLQDMVHLGFDMPSSVMGLLLRLSYIQLFKVRGENVAPAIQLKPTSRVLPLFPGTDQHPESLRL